jgi:hypothetical protein
MQATGPMGQTLLRSALSLREPYRLTRACSLSQGLHALHRPGLAKRTSVEPLVRQVTIKRQATSRRWLTVTAGEKKKLVFLGTPEVCMPTLAEAYICARRCWMEHHAHVRPCWIMGDSIHQGVYVKTSCTTPSSSSPSPLPPPPPSPSPSSYLSSPPHLQPGACKLLPSKSHGLPSIFWPTLLAKPEAGGGNPDARGKMPHWLTACSSPSAVYGCSSAVGKK